MTEDRFEDLGRDDGRSAGERLAERDRTHPEPVQRRPEIPRPGNRYAWLVGILMLMVLTFVLFANTLRHKGEGTLGPPRGRLVPAFAAPLATGDLEGDANVCQRRCTRNSGPVPACQIQSRDVLNVCDLRRRPLVLTFVFDRGADCNPQVDRVQDVSRAFPGVNFAVVYFSHKPRAELRAIVERRGWKMPVGVDRDGAVANLYGVGVCPTTVFTRAGGRVATTKLGELTEQELGTQIRRVTRG